MIGLEKRLKMEIGEMDIIHFSNSGEIDIEFIKKGGK